MVQQGATWDKKHTARSGYSKGTACDHCGQDDADFAHVSWHCPALHDVRQKAIVKFCPGLKPEMLHPAMLYGIAPAMSPLHYCINWGTTLDHVQDDNIKRCLGIARCIKTNCEQRAK